MPANVTLLPAEDDVETGSPLSEGGFREEATGRITCNFNGICSYMPCDVLTLIMRWGSAFYAEGTNRGTIAENSSQKELADRALSLLHDQPSRVFFWVSRWLLKRCRNSLPFTFLYVSSRLARYAREGKGIGKGKIESWNGSPGMVQGYPQSTLLAVAASRAKDKGGPTLSSVPTLRRRYQDDDDDDVVDDVKLKMRMEANGWRKEVRVE
ncbi:hypothetical protein G5I_05411 [Acromyrmex echinatior]|uniref:Uncharacterized protein n=1 Tax=Acromyrmex echinatior TaxID=103372 RepID=F4WI89_ACREC|nr:hypothetical protein G5I_05411 [Acromyrmex echinatior]